MIFKVLKSAVSLGTVFILLGEMNIKILICWGKILLLTYCASVWLLPGVPSHVDDQHVLLAKRSALAEAPVPITGQFILDERNVVILEVL